MIIIEISLETLYLYLLLYSYIDYKQNIIKDMIEIK